MNATADIARSRISTKGAELFDVASVKSRKPKLQRARERFARAEAERERYDRANDEFVLAAPMSVVREYRNAKRDLMRAEKAAAAAAGKL